MRITSFVVAGVVISFAGLDARAVSNDDFSGRIALSGGNAGDSSENVGATIEANEPFASDEGARESIWYSWTAPADGQVEFSTVGNGSFTHILGVYTGNGLRSLSAVDEEVAVAPLFATISTNTTKGTTYQIAIATYTPSTIGGVTRINVNFTSSDGGGNNGGNGDGAGGGNGSIGNTNRSSSPRVKLFSPKQRVTSTSANRVRVRGRIRDDESVRKITLRIDGRQTKVRRSGRFNRSVKLKAPRSRNVIRIRAADRDGNVTRRKRIVFQEILGTVSN
ncbi:MAG: hypothetical protein WA771_06430 [Chthoniobacterales bacterium]